MDPKIRTLQHYLNLSAHHAVECNPTRTGKTVSNGIIILRSSQITHYSSVFIAGVHRLGHWEYTSHGCIHIEARLVEMMHPFDMLENKDAVPNRLVPDLYQG